MAPLTPENAVFTSVRSRVCHYRAHKAKPRAKNARIILRVIRSDRGDRKKSAAYYYLCIVRGVCIYGATRRRTHAEICVCTLPHVRIRFGPAVLYLCIFGLEKCARRRFMLLCFFPYIGDELCNVRACEKI
jgi:hypothetical protein